MKLWNICNTKLNWHRHNKLLSLSSLYKFNDRLEYKWMKTACFSMLFVLLCICHFYLVLILSNTNTIYTYINLNTGGIYTLSRSHHRLDRRWNAKNWFHTNLFHHHMCVSYIGRQRYFENHDIQHHYEMRWLFSFGMNLWISFIMRSFWLTMDTWNWPSFPILLRSRCSRCPNT